MSLKLTFNAVGLTLLKSLVGGLTKALSKSSEDFSYRQLKASYLNGRLNLQALNRTLTVNHSIPSSDDLTFETNGEADGQGQEQGSAYEFLLPGPTFLRILNNISSGSLTFTRNKLGTSVHIVYHNATSMDSAESHFNVTTQSVEDYPLVISFNRPNYIELDSLSFLNSLRSSSIATDSTNSHYALGGVHMEYSYDVHTLNVVATDGRRMLNTSLFCTEEGTLNRTECTIPLPFIDAFKSSYISARQPKNATESKVSDADEQATNRRELLVRISIEDNYLWSTITGFNGVTTTLRSNLLEGRFPNWRAIIPRNQVSTDESCSSLAVEASPVILLNSLNLACATFDNKGDVNVSFTFSEDALTLKGVGKETGDSTSSLSLSYTGPKVEVTLNSQYVKDFLDRLTILEDEPLVIHLTDNTKPIWITYNSQNACTIESVDYVVMPICQ